MNFKLNKYANNPILKANDANQWESLCVLNPAAYYEDGTFYLLYRAAGNDKEHYIYLGLATSTDGFNFERESDKPVLSPDINGSDGGCIEDPRIVKMGDTFYVTYAARAYAPGQYWSLDWQPLGNPPLDGPHFLTQNNSLTHLAITKDFKAFKKLGRITDSRLDNRDVIIFPEKINGRYVMLSRPVEWVGEAYGCTIPSIFIGYSDDMMEWKEHTLLMTGEQDWESKKIGGSTPPIRTNEGWLHLYHGVSADDDAYRVGAVLLDLNDPSKIIARTREFIMEPEFPYETSGFYNKCVFPTGVSVKDDTLYVYYGAADKHCCVATCSLSEFVSYLKTECSV